MFAHTSGRATYAWAGLVLLLSTYGIASAQTVNTGGLIKAREGDSLILQTSNAPNLTVVLNDRTEVGQVEGLFKSRRKEMSMAALIPGLAVKVKGTYNEQNELVAAEVSFKGDDLKRAEAIQAGLHETTKATEQHGVELARQQADLEKHEAHLSQHREQIAAATARFGQLDDYYIFDEVTVYFDNGQTGVAPKYAPPLLELAEKAKTIDGYVIEVKGYASPTGKTELNQQLSEDRADAVTNILIQQGHIPLTRMLAPGAMGESHQLGNNRTEQEQAANRRVVVRVLQNKAIAGK